jgi:hypothetical protein
MAADTKRGEKPKPSWTPFKILDIYSNRYYAAAYGGGVVREQYINRAQPKAEDSPKIPTPAHIESSVAEALDPGPTPEANGASPATGDPDAPTTSSPPADDDGEPFQRLGSASSSVLLLSEPSPVPLTEGSTSPEPLRKKHHEVAQTPEISTPMATVGEAPGPRKEQKAYDVSEALTFSTSSVTPQNLVQNPQAVYQHIHEMSTKRISTLDYFRQVYGAPRHRFLGEG